MGLVVGVVGGIGSGKTAVTDRFAHHGITIADSDVAARTVVEPGTPALTVIVEHFGEAILNEDGTLNRPRMREIVFADAEERSWLESVTVPAILDELRRILEESTSPYAILMLSGRRGQSPMIDHYLVVDVPTEVQIARVMARDNNPREQVEAIIKAQTPREQRLAFADDVIVNDGPLDVLHERVDALHLKYLEMAKVHA